ncbi:MAG: hypothetical protein AAF266_03745 [Planctomycetota bacterium]
MYLLLESAGFWTTLLADFTATQRFVLCLTVVGSLAIIVFIGLIVAIGTWEKVRRHEAEVELTRDLLDQGKSADEIEKIVRPSDGLSRALKGWWAQKAAR